MEGVLGVRRDAVLVEVEALELAFRRDAEVAVALTAYMSARPTPSVALVTIALPIICAARTWKPPP
jgi:hypothetical protein